MVTDREAIVYRLSAESLDQMEAEHPGTALAFHRFMAEFTSERLLLTTQTLEAISE